MRWRLRVLRDNISRLIYWIPKIWRDRDWDSAYLYEMMRYKLIRMRDEIQNSASHTSWERDVQNMTVAIELLNRLDNTGYNDYYSDMHNVKLYYCLDCTVTAEKEFFDFIGKRCTECSNKWKSAYLVSQKHENADFSYLWEIMRKHSRQWWN